jgi:hypothetical protein
MKGKIGMQQFEMPSQFSSNKLYLEGQWNIQDEYAESLSDSIIFFNYNAKNVYLVAGADEDLESSIYLDGVFLKKISIKNEDLYNIVEGNSYSQHILEIKTSKGLKAFAFTFG